MGARQLRVLGHHLHPLVLVQLQPLNFSRDGPLRTRSSRLHAQFHQQHFQLLPVGTSFRYSTTRGSMPLLLQQL